MNYRHAYHAGNFADVLKHVVLALAIDYLKRKEAPFRIIDTHAGCGRYALDAPEALKTREWEGGIGRLIGTDAVPLPRDVAEVMEPYLAAVRALNVAGGLSSYPGSPLIASALMRSQDRLVASELHPEDVARLKDALGQDRRAKVLPIDAWTALKSLLPPKERRGIILIDPPFEAEDEFDRLADGLEEGLRRFSTGVFIAWFPIKQPTSVRQFIGEVAQRLGRHGCLRVDLSLGEPTHPEGRLQACGLIVINPPFPLEGQLALVMPELTRRLGESSGASFRVEGIGLRQAPEH
jgi:23S rRNA (adenine2030-N6)-methyltransferase